MKKLLFFISVFSFLFLVTPVAMAQQMASMQQGAMPWSTKSKQAKALTDKAIRHILNVEREQAYHDFKAAAEMDQGFVLPNAFLANLSSGETRKTQGVKTNAIAAGKTEAEKLLASMVAETATADSRREAWAKLHTMYPNDRFVGHYYAISRTNVDEQFTAMSDYIRKFPEEPAMYNMMGYYYLTEKKDNAKAKEYFEKYIQLYPDGANPYDSMGEFYMLTGDTENAEKYYKLALEKYPFMVSSIQALEKINAGKTKAEN
ncbi:tetratricopeptide repeat protein [Flavisolibacter sp. BT320]|nr:tetratricopeptide repeat protein [Flavisolibacter longurius]